MHPSSVTGNAYSQDMREFVMFMSQPVKQNNPNIANLVNLLKTNHTFPSAIIQHHLEELDNNLGLVLPCKRTGNNIVQL